MKLKLKSSLPAPFLRAVHWIRSLDLSAKMPDRFPVRVVLGLLIVGILGTGYYFYDRYQDATSNPQAAAQREAENLIASVGRLIVLPTDEAPTIATVSDPERLKNQPFFANAKVGDKVLIYTNAKKAILYDPAADKIVEVAPVNLGSMPTPTPTPTPGGRR